MAGEWLKFECSLPDKPETLAITVSMGWEDPDTTVGKLMRVFRWFDQQTTDGNAHGVTPALLDRLIGVSGFVQAMADVGWMVITPNCLTLNNFDRHNGKTAKERALTAKRVAKLKANGKANAEGNAPTVSSPLPREEKKREEEANASVGARPSRKCPQTFEVTPEMQEWAGKEAPGVDVERETAKLRDHTFASARTDWPATWRNWMREASDRQQGRQPSAKQQPAARHTDSYEETQRLLAERNRNAVPAPAFARELADKLTGRKAAA